MSDIELTLAVAETVMGWKRWAKLPYKGRTRRLGFWRPPLWKPSDDYMEPVPPDILPWDGEPMFADAYRGPSFATDDAAAPSVVHKMRDLGFAWKCSLPLSTNPLFTSVFSPQVGSSSVAHCSTFARAVCESALKAMKATI